jgi:hypothetical protein
MGAGRVCAARLSRFGDSHRQGVTGYLAGMSDENVELVREGYEAWNRGDLDWPLDHITPDYEFRTAQLFPDTEAVYRGREGLRQF